MYGGGPGRANANWRGGKFRIKGSGYVMCYVPGHPNANRKGYVYEHRLKVSKKMGRALRKGEVVHHKNGNTSDNRLRNLELLSKGEHTRHHLRGHKWPKNWNGAKGFTAAQINHFWNSTWLHKRRRRFICGNCEQEFRPASLKQKFCSLACRDVYRTGRARTYSAPEAKSVPFDPKRHS